MLIQVPRISKPPQGVGLNPGHRLAPDLGAWIFSEGAGPYANNLAYDDRLIASAPPTVPTWTGGGVSFASTAGFSLGAPYARYRPTAFTIAARIRPASTTGNQDIVRADDVASNRNYFFRVQGGVLNGFTFLGVNSNAVGSTTLTAGRWWDVAYTFSGVTGTVWISGVSNGSAAGSGSFSGSPSTLYLGNYVNAGEPYTGVIEYVYMYSWVLAPADLKSIAANPYQVTAPYPMWIPTAPMSYVAPASFSGNLFDMAGGFFH